MQPNLRAVHGKHHPIRKQLTQLLAGRASSQYLTLGAQVTRTVASAASAPLSLYSADSALLTAFAADHPSASCWLLAPNIWQSCFAELSYPPDLVAAFARPAIAELPATSYSELATRVLILEDLQDPGNFGNICRSAVLLGWPTILLIGHVADPYKPKVLQASSGAVAQLTFYRLPSGALAELAQHRQLVGAALNPEAQSLQAFLAGRTHHGRATAPLALALGNEGNGLSAELLEHCQHLIQIEQASNTGSLDSLNVSSAAAIMLYLLR